MKDINIKCNNRKEADFIVKYLLDQKYILANLNDINFYNFDFKQPVIIFNGIINEKFIYFSTIFLDKSKITEAKHIMRKEKLKNIIKDDI